MEVVLHKKPTGVTVIQGFPGFGLVGSIATEFLVEHLKAQYIGHIWLESLPPTVAIHRGERINPISLYYSQDHNIVLIHGITGAKGTEWDIARAAQQLVNELQATQLICLEGIGVSATEDPHVMYYSSEPHFSENIEKLGYKRLQEGVVLGVTGATLIRTKNVPITCFFAETHSELPDSKGGAKLIEALDKYIGFNVDYHPLLEQAAVFEEKLKTMLSQAADAEKEQIRKQETYIG